MTWTGKFIELSGRKCGKALRDFLCFPREHLFVPMMLRCNEIRRQSLCGSEIIQQILMFPTVSHYMTTLSRRCIHYHSPSSSSLSLHHPKELWREHFVIRLWVWRTKKNYVFYTWSALCTAFAQEATTKRASTDGKI